MTTRGHRPNITTCGSELGCSKQQDPNYGLRGLQINIQAPAAPGCPKLPPGNPRLLVDVHKEPTFEVGEVLL